MQTIFTMHRDADLDDDVHQNQMADARTTLAEALAVAQQAAAGSADVGNQLHHVRRTKTVSQ